MINKELFWVSSCVTDYHMCAQDWTRTSMPFRAPPPQGGASTNFATWAGGAADKGSRLSEDNPDFNKNL